MLAFETLDDRALLSLMLGRSRLVAEVMTTAFGASDAGGGWTWRNAYDAIEAATVLQVRRLAPQVARLKDAPAGSRPSSPTSPRSA